MLKHKGAHGSGVNLTFPGSDEIEANMKGHPSDYKVNIYGDGSFTSPTVWWAALGGFGIWVPKWQPELQHEGRDGLPELAATDDGVDGTGQQQQIKDVTTYFGAALGQT